ncbi:unnamed protein product, partial [Closterium sp. NIES-53]
DNLDDIWRVLAAAAAAAGCPLISLLLPRLCSPTQALEALRNDTRLVRSDNLDDIWRVLASAKYRRWEEEAKARREKQQALGDELRLLLKNRLCQQVSQLLVCCYAARAIDVSF